MFEQSLGVISQPEVQIKGHANVNVWPQLIGSGGILNQFIISCIVIRLPNLRWRVLKLLQVTDALIGLAEPTLCSALALCSTYFVVPKLARRNRSFKGNIDFFFVCVIDDYPVSRDG